MMDDDWFDPISRIRGKLIKYFLLTVAIFIVLFSFETAMGLGLALMGPFSPGHFR